MEKSIIQKRLKSLIEIKTMLKKYDLDDPVRYNAINELNIIFKKYIYGTEDIITTLPFEEFNRVIEVRLYTKSPHNNVVVLKRQS